MALFVRRRWPKVAAAVGIAAAVVALVVLAVRDRTPATTGNPDLVIVTPAESPPPEATPSPLPLATILEKPAAYEGRPVGATSVTVQSVVSPSVVWVGPSEAQRVLVLVVSADTSFSGVAAGSQLTFIGVVRTTTQSCSGRAATSR
jgi:hypothetical protein